MNTGDRAEAVKRRRRSGGVRGRLAVCCAGLTYRMIRKLHKGDGGTLPGYVARQMDPEILSRLSGMVREKIIVVMGTNGKTTTANMLCHVLENAGKRVVINRTGANMINGITSAFVLASEKNGCLDADYACVEVDELAAAEVLSRLRPHCVILTNIFRDQLDRFGETDLVIDKIREALSAVPDALLVINGDDALSCSLAYGCRNPVAFYGIKEAFTEGGVYEGIRETACCHLCGEPLVYDFFHYGQLGSWRCPKCGTKRPEPDYFAEDIAAGKEGFWFRLKAAESEPEERKKAEQEAAEGEIISPEAADAKAAEWEAAGLGIADTKTAEGETAGCRAADTKAAEGETAGCRAADAKTAGRETADAETRGTIKPEKNREPEKRGSGESVRANALYNIYNTLSAYAALCAMDAPAVFAAALEDFDYSNHRERVFAIGGGRVRLHLAKNPMGFQQKLKLLLEDPAPKDVIIQINDTELDGQDVSWLWDVDFQALGDAGAREIVVDGTRRYDMGLRLKYEEITWNFTADLRKTVRKLAAEGTGNLYMIVNYSGLYRSNHILERLQKGEYEHETDHRAFIPGAAQLVR